MTKYAVNEAVVLPAFEGNPEVNGTVLAVEDGNGMYVVQVQAEDDSDDGIREVHEDQMRGMP